jgi:hypothetical protein
MSSQKPAKRKLTKSATSGPPGKKNCPTIIPIPVKEEVEVTINGIKSSQ